MEYVLDLILNLVVVLPIVLLGVVICVGITNKLDREKKLIELLEEQNEMIRMQGKHINEMRGAIQHIRYMTLNELSLSTLDKETLDKNVKLYNEDMERIIKDLEYERRKMELQLQRQEGKRSKKKMKRKEKNL